MSLNIRKEFFINENLQEKLKKTAELTGNKEAPIMRVAILEYCKKMLKDT